MAKPRRKSTPPSKTPKAKSAPARAKVPMKTKPAAKATPKPPAKAKPSAKAAPAKKQAPKAKPLAKPKAKPPAKAGAKVVLAPAKVAARPKPPAPPAPPPRRSTYVDAVALYERGVQALQARRYSDAANTLAAVITQFPDEKELHERAHLYIRVCERQLEAAAAKPESLDDRVYAATLAINDAQIDKAISILTAVVSEDAEHDHAVYMLGVSYALKGNYPLAVQHLTRAMALNFENRDLARKEPDLEALRRTEDMRALLAAPPPPLPRRDKRPVVRGRSK